MGNVIERLCASFHHPRSFRVFVANFCCRDTEPGSRDPVAVEPPSCPSRRQCPAGNPETTPVLSSKIRAARELMFCSISASFAVKSPNELLIAATSRFVRISSSLSSVVLLERAPSLKIGSETVPCSRPVERF